MEFIFGQEMQLSFDVQIIDTRLTQLSQESGGAVP